MLHLFIRLFSKSDNVRIKTFWVLCALIAFGIIVYMMNPPPQTSPQVERPLSTQPSRP